MPATIVHPWNEELVERDGVIGARDWDGLREQLEPVLGARSGSGPWLLESGSHG